MRRHIACSTLISSVNVCMCGLTGMSSASIDIFSLFASDSGTYVVREDVENMLRSVDGEVPSSLKKCFTEVSTRQYHSLTCLFIMAR